MKRLPTILAGTALLALGACASRTANNIAATDNLTNDVYDVAPDSMTANDLGNDSGNATSGSNGSSTSNATSGRNVSSGSNATRSGHSSSSHGSGNSH